MAVLAFLRTYWRPLAVLILLMLLSTCCYQKGAEHERVKWQAKLSAMREQAAYNQAQAEAKARKQEADWAAAFDLSATIYQESYNDLQKRRDRIIADMRSGRVSLKPARCGVPQAPANSGQPQAAPESGQPGLAGEELVSRLATADEVVIERNQCVELLKAERL